MEAMYNSVNADVMRKHAHIDLANRTSGVAHMEAVYIGSVAWIHLP